MDMTYEQFDEMYQSNYDLQDSHMDYILKHNDGERVICNGDTLIEAAEDRYLYEEFRAQWIKNYR
jgi:hypothetical protein